MAAFQVLNALIESVESIIFRNAVNSTGAFLSQLVFVFRSFVQDNLESARSFFAADFWNGRT